MADLPDSLPLDSPNSTPLPIASVAPTDFGLGQAQSALESAAVASRRADFYEQRAKSKADLASVQGDLAQFKEANTQAASVAQGQWNGGPGLAKTVLADANERAQRWVENNPDYTPGQRAEFAKAANKSIADLGNSVNTYEGTKLLEQQVDTQVVQTNNATSTFWAGDGTGGGYGDDKQNLIDNWPPTSKGLGIAGLAAFDAHQRAVEPLVPLSQRPHFEAEMSAKRAVEAADYTKIEGEAHNAYVLKNGGDQATALTNSIAANPTAYDGVVAALPAIASTMPAAHAAEVLHSWMGDAAYNRVHGLILRQDFKQASLEMSDGRYEAVLSGEKMASLESELAAQDRAHGQSAITQGIIDAQGTSALAADEVAVRTTGQSSLDPDKLGAIAASMTDGGKKVGEHLVAIDQAKRDFAASGSTRQLSDPDLQAIAAYPPPQPKLKDGSDNPNYAAEKRTWDTNQSIIKDEQNARQSSPGALVWGIDPKLDGGKAPAAASTLDPAADPATLRDGQVLQSQWQGVVNNPGDTHAAAIYAGHMLGAQYWRGTPPSSRQILPQSVARALALPLINATPETMLAEAAKLGAIVHALPTGFTLPDGSTAGPQTILYRQLAWAGLNPALASAVVDYGADQAKLGPVVAALTNEKLKPLTQGQENLIKTGVATQLATYLASNAGAPGAADLNPARIQRTILVTHGIMALNPDVNAAIKQAVGQATSSPSGQPYLYMGSTRVPAQLQANMATIQQGLARALHTAGTGGNLYPPDGLAQGTKAQEQVYAAKVLSGGVWMTDPDDRGVTLMTPHNDGTFDPVADYYGKKIHMTWDEAQGAAKWQPEGGGGGAYRVPFGHEPPNWAHAPDGTPVPAVSNSVGMTALMDAVKWKEGFQGKPSPKGAQGDYQLTEAAVKDYAPRIGEAPDIKRAATDQDYNKRVAYADMADQIKHFGSTPAGLALATAAYNAGRGPLEGFTRAPYTDKQGVHHGAERVPGWLQTIGDPRTGKISPADFVARIPYHETKDYVTDVLPRAYANLTSQKGR